MSTHQSNGFQVGGDDGCRDLRDDRVAVGAQASDAAALVFAWRYRGEAFLIGAQASHSGGSPMSQRECAGFNWPPLSIPAEDPVSSSPLAVRRIGCGGAFFSISVAKLLLCAFGLCVAPWAW